MTLPLIAAAIATALALTSVMLCACGQSGASSTPGGFH
jgi:hypothetical protein